MIERPIQTPSELPPFVREVGVGKWHVRKERFPGASCCGTVFESAYLHRVKEVQRSAETPALEDRCNALGCAKAFRKLENP